MGLSHCGNRRSHVDVSVTKISSPLLKVDLAKEFHMDLDY